MGTTAQQAKAQGVRMKFHSALTSLMLASIALLVNLASANGYTVPNDQCRQVVRAPATLSVKYRPFSFAHPLPRAGFTVLGYAPLKPVRPSDIITVADDSDKALLWDLLNPQDQRAQPSKRHPGVGRFDQSCLEIVWPGAASVLQVDENGIVSNGDCYFKLSRPVFKRLDHVLNGLWYAQSPFNQKNYSREKIDLTSEELKS